MPLNEDESSSGNQSQQRQSQVYAIPGSPQYDYVNSAAFNLPQDVTYDYAIVDASLKNDRYSGVESDRMGLYMNIREANDEGSTHDEGYVIGLQPAENGDIYGSDTIQDYVIERPYTKNGDNYGSDRAGDYVIERPYTKKEEIDGTDTGDYVIGISNIDKGDTYSLNTTEGYVIVRGETEKQDTDVYAVPDES